MQGYQTVQLTYTADMRLYFLLQNAIYILYLNHLIGGDAFLCTDVRDDISRHPAKMDCLESVSDIAQMLTAAVYTKPRESTFLKWNILEIGSTITQMEQDHDRL